MVRPVIKIAPSLLSANFARLGDDVRHILGSGADWLHLDIMDGHFVDNLTFGPPVVKHLREQEPHAFLDCHLMVSDPEKWFEPLCELNVNQIIFHVESCHVNQEIDQVTDLIQKLKNKNVRVGISFKPNTPIDLEKMKSYIEHGLDYVLIMTVEPGFGGQELIPECLNKVKILREGYPELDIGVDGGVHLGNIKECAEAGANVIVSGSGIFRHYDWDAKALAIAELRDKAKIHLYVPKPDEPERINLLQGLMSSVQENGRVVIVFVMAGAVCWSLLSDPKTCQEVPATS